MHSIKAWGGLALAALLAGQLAAQTYNGSGGPILDVTSNEFPLTVTGLSPSTIDTATFGLETVCIDLTHTWDSDLEISIIAPDGTVGLLASGVGGADDNFTNTCFNQGAAVSIVNGTAPFTGTFRPQGQMGLVNNGQNGNGTWRLRVNDVVGGDAGDLLGWSITFGSNPATYNSFSSSNLPIVVINAPQSIPQTGKITADMGIIYNGPGVRNYVTDPWNNYNGKIGIEVRGNFSAYMPQKPYEFETRDINGANLDAPLLGLPAENDWVLLAAYNDKPLVYNGLAYDLFTKMGHWASRLRLCEVVLNGEYQGIYMLGEKIKRDANRVDVATLNPADITWPEVSGGYILKTDYHDQSNSWLLNYHPIDHPSFDVYMVYHYPKPADIVQAQRTYIQGFVNDLEAALYGGNFADTTLGFRRYMSMRSFIDYFIVNELSRNNDGFKKSVYFYKEKDDLNGTIGKLKAGPVWDFDWAWKNIPGCGIFSATNGSGWAHKINDCNPDVNGTGWYVRLLQDSTFANALNCRWTELRAPGALLDTTRLWHFIDSIATYADEAQQRHYGFWGHMGAATGTPEVDPPAQSYPEEIAKLKAWIRTRIAWLDANMPGNSLDCNLVSSPAALPAQAMGSYPNPFRERLRVQAADVPPGELRLRLHDLLGRAAMPGRVVQHGGGALELDLQGLGALPTGTYVLEVQTAAGRWTQRVMKVE